MIPEKKKSPEELAALREGLGIPDAPPQPGEQRKRPAAPPLAESPVKPLPPREEPLTRAAPVLDPAHPHESPPVELRESAVHLDLPAPTTQPEETGSAPVVRSLRKHELPLAPAPAVTHKTTLPRKRHGAKDIAELRRRDALQNLGGEQNDPARHLKGMTAHWALLVPAYLLAFAAAAAAWQRVHHITPLVLLVLSSIFSAYIFFSKKRSRHHAAILTIIIIMTLVFGGLYYAPLFQNAP